MKELKVRIPISYHVHLHSLKVLTGKPISDAVTEALERYFGREPEIELPFDGVLGPGENKP